MRPGDQLNSSGFLLNHRLARRFPMQPPSSRSRFINSLRAVKTEGLTKRTYILLQSTFSSLIFPSSATRKTDDTMLSGPVARVPITQETAGSTLGRLHHYLIYYQWPTDNFNVVQ